MPPEKLIPLAIIPIMLVVMLLKNRRKRVLKPQLLWVMPAIVLPLIGLGLWGTAQNPNMAHAPFGPAAWAVLAIGGGAEGRMGHVRVLSRAP